jgi:SAM-dependent methyltransferase
LVDLAAGTGKLTLAIAPSLGQVIAVDVSPAMVSLLRTRVAEAGLTNVSCVHGGFLTYSHVGPPVDAVYTRNALHQIPDFWKGVALERIAGMLAPGGVLVVRDLIYDFEPSDADAVFASWLDGAVDDPRHGYTREDFEVHIRSEHSTFRWLFEPLLHAAGFEIIAVDYGRSIYASYSCVKRSS